LSFGPDLTLRPDVAEEVPTTANGGISADGKTYTFKLRSDVTWSDGQKVTARDFEYGLKRVLSPELGADCASFYFAIAGAEAYAGANDKDAATRQQLRNAVAIEAVDDATLKVTLSQSNRLFSENGTVPRLPGP